MKLATLVCLCDGQVNGDVENFDISTEEGKQKAIDAWTERIKDCYCFESEANILSRIEEGIREDYSYVGGEFSFQLFWNDLI